MDIKDIIIFKSVASFGNLTKAAESLNYTQSNVTARIGQLEKELEVELFTRNARGVILTSAGEVFLDYAKKIVALQDEVYGVLHDGSKGKLKIGMIVEVAVLKLPYILREFKRLCPNIELIMDIDSTDGLIKKLLNYELDGIFVDGPVKNEDLVEEIFIDDEIVLISGKELKNPRDLRVLCGDNFIVVSDNCIYKRRFESWVKSEEVALPKTMKVGTWEGIFTSVVLNLGFSVTIRSLAEKYTGASSLFIYELPSEYNHNPIVFLRRKDRPITLTFKNFIKASSQKTISDTINSNW